MGQNKALLRKIRISERPYALSVLTVGGFVDKLGGGPSTIDEIDAIFSVCQGNHIKIITNAEFCSRGNLFIKEGLFCQM